jgi:hypothetical protein
MNKIALTLIFACVSAMAAPPVVAPGGLTQQQMIAHRQGVDIGARHSAAQSVAGSRSDEYAAINPGSGQARFLFNSTVMNSIGQNSSQPGLSSANSLSSAYISYVEKGAATNGIQKVVPNSYTSRVEKSQVQRMVFLDAAQVTHMKIASESTQKMINEMAPKISK